MQSYRSFPNKYRNMLTAQIEPQQRQHHLLSPIQRFDIKMLLDDLKGLHSKEHLHLSSSVRGKDQVLASYFDEEEEISKREKEVESLRERIDLIKQLVDVESEKSKKLLMLEALKSAQYSELHNSLALILLLSSLLLLVSYLVVG